MLISKTFFLAFALQTLSVLAFANDEISRILKTDLNRGSQFYFSMGGAHPVEFGRGEVNTPASLAKLFTIHMALDEFGYNKQFSMQARWLESSTSSSTISNLEIVGEGDPDFDIQGLIAALKNRGVKTIIGGILFKPARTYRKPEDRSQISDSGYCYNALPNFLNYQKNCVALVATANGIRSTDPDLKVKLKSNLTLGSKYNGTRPHFKWTNNSKTDFEYVIDVSLKDSSQSAQVDVVVPDTEKWLQNKFERLAKEAGIDFSNSASSSLNTSQQMTIPSTSLEDLACSTLIESDNLKAQFLFDHLDASTLLQTQNSFGIEMADGSGMSRENIIDGSALLDLLSQIETSSSRFSYFKDCLPSPGSLGTLDDRLLDLNNLVVAKTGSLRGISNLAGFFRPNEQAAWVPFVFLLQNPELRVSQLRQQQDRVLLKIQKMIK